MTTRRITSLIRLMIIFVLITPQSFQAQPQRTSIALMVDATEAPRKILHAKETIAVRPGPLTLFYPEWIPGEHGPTGPVIDVAGLRIMASDKPLPWRRDLEEMYAIHCEVPIGVDRLDLTFDFLLPPKAEGFSSGASSSAQLAVISWNQVVLYPKDGKPDDVIVSPSLKLPQGWKYATALQTKEQVDGIINFTPVSLMMLVDSPVLAGAHFRRIDLTPEKGVPHFLNLASDDDEALEISPGQIAAYRRLVLEANALFGAHHYEHYDFLYTLSDQVAHFGLEHHQSSDNRSAERTLIDSTLRKISVTLLSHEFVHSWNGKHRRPSGLATGDFSTPMKGDLLWVYEGLTQYLGKLLAARSGLRSAEEYREDLAMLAARLDNRPGREWRTLQDVADEAQLLYYSRQDWDSWRRSVDFYDESDLIWLEADAMIRQLTGGKKSLDDFCRRFHGGESSGPIVKPYTFEELVATLNEVAPYDWRTFFTNRLESLNPHAPLGGIEMSGWKLVYKDLPSSLQKEDEDSRKYTDLRYSVGTYLQENGTMIDVIPGTPAALAGLGPGMKLIAVNGRKYSKEIIRAALKASTKSASPLELLVVNGEFFKTYSVDYQGGERYPHLVQDTTKPDLLSAIIKPIATKSTEQKGGKSQ